MPPAANSDDPAADPADDPADLAALARYTEALLVALEDALPRWVERMVAERWGSERGAPLSAEVRDAVAGAARQARDDVMPRLRALLSRDVADQRANPLAVLREAVVHPGRVLAEAGIRPVDRDPQSARMFPDDLYDLTPASFADVDPSVHEPGIHWGAAKAHVLMRRRRGSP